MIQKMFKSLLEFMMGNRQTGHTSLLNDLAKKNDIYIIVENEDAKDIFDPEVQDKLISLNRLDKLIGDKNKPVLIDNAALQLMLREILLEIGRIEYESSERHQYLLQFDHMLNSYRQRFRKDFNFENTVAQSAIRMSGDYLNQNQK